MIKKFSSPKMQNRQFVFTPKIQYKLVAERSEANQNRLQFPTWCSILKIVRTHFAACGGEAFPRLPAEASAQAGSRTDDNFKFFFDGIQL